jgi:hypothetical protein
MQQLQILFREPDGRKDMRSTEDIARHRSNWHVWQQKIIGENRLACGMPLTLNGKVIKGKEHSMVMPKLGKLWRSRQPNELILKILSFVKSLIHLRY